jgi:hypothetical protein
MMAFAAAAIWSHFAPVKRRYKIVSTFCRSIIVTTMSPGDADRSTAPQTQTERQLFIDLNAWKRGQFRAGLTGIRRLFRGLGGLPSA